MTVDEYNDLNNAVNSTDASIVAAALEEIEAEHPLYDVELCGVNAPYVTTSNAEVMESWKYTRHVCAA